jgi:hypothetical protein
MASSDANRINDSLRAAGGRVPGLCTLCGDPVVRTLWRAVEKVFAQQWVAAPASIDLDAVMSDS